MTRPSPAALALGALVVLAPAVALAAGGAGHSEGIDWKELGFAFLNFAIFLGGLIFLLRKPLREFLSHRRATLQDALAEAARLRAEAEARLREVEGRLANLDAERERILAQYRQEGEEEKARLVERARQTAEAMRREIQMRIQQEARDLELRLRAKVVAEAIALAERLVRAEITAQDRVRYADEYIEKLKAVPPPTAH